MAEGWQERLEQEYKELSERVDKLGTFLEQDAFNSLSETDRGLLAEQYQVMREYQTILAQRLSRVIGDTLMKEKPRLETATQKEKDLLPRQADSVLVTSADFNGESWDGSPFSPSPAPAWLFHALRRGAIKVAKRKETVDRDYTIFDVRTSQGIVTALPGDRIRADPRNPFMLSVAEKPEKWRDPARNPLSSAPIEDEPQKEESRRSAANELIEFTVVCRMKRRWASQFLGMLKHMQRLGNAGSSRSIGIFSDGDGDFRPRFDFTVDAEPAEGLLDGQGNCWFDAG